MCASPEIGQYCTAEGRESSSVVVHLKLKSPTSCQKQVGVLFSSFQANSANEDFGSVRDSLLGRSMETIQNVEQFVQGCAGVYLHVFNSLCI